MGDKIEVILQIMCFLNYWEVTSCLQVFLQLAELIFAEKMGPFYYISISPQLWKNRGEYKLFFFSFSESCWTLYFLHICLWAQFLLDESKVLGCGLRLLDEWGQTGIYWWVRTIVSAFSYIPFPSTLCIYSFPYFYNDHAHCSLILFKLLILPLP